MALLQDHTHTALMQDHNDTASIPEHYYHDSVFSNCSVNLFQVEFHLSGYV